MKDQFCSFYTNSEDITFYMSSRLGIHDGDIILEPSAGEGIFIDEVLKTKKKVHIDALDINDDAISVLQKSTMIILMLMFVKLILFSILNLINMTYHNCG